MVTSPGRNLLVTAAHCLFGQKDAQMVFVPGYDRQDAGSTLKYCSGWTVNGVLLAESQSTAVICRLVQGSSGGPRYSTLDDRTGAGTIFSINSFGVTVYFKDGSTDRNEYFWGTYLGDEVYRLYESVAVVVAP